MAEINQAFAEITKGQGKMTRVPLIGSRVVIGRAADAGVRLDSNTVSRQHVELFRDPFGRWWMRDLKSRNGTRLNDVVTAEGQIHDGDRIGIEDFEIRIFTPGAGTDRTKSIRGVRSTAGITMVEQQVSPVQRLDKMAAPKIAGLHLSALMAFSSSLLVTEEDHARLTKLCRLMVSPEFHGTHAVVLRLDKKRSEDEAEPQLLCPAEAATGWSGGTGTPYVSKTILRALRQNPTPVVASSVGSTNAMEMSMVGANTPMSAIGCPIFNDANWLDILYVIFPAEYGTSEWLALAALASEQYHQAEDAWESRRKSQAQALIESELKRAHQIQLRLVPRKVDFRDIEVDIGFEPCRWVGGDYIDVVLAGDSRVFIIVADVCGKGLQAALITASLHAMIRTNMTPNVTLPDLMTRLNNYLCETLPDESFVTICSLMIDTNTGEFECINGGHPPAMIADPAGRIRELMTGQNLPFGCMPARLFVEKDKLNPGDILTLYTDGLSELHDETGALLGTDKLSDYLSSSVKMPPNSHVGDIGKRFRGMLDSFQGNALAQDDRTYMLCRLTRLGIEADPEATAFPATKAIPSASKT
jgi:serine phosphatase RsbU (regulator of sigma subunit)